MIKPSIISGLKFRELLLFLAVLLLNSCSASEDKAEKENIGKSIFEKNCSLCHGNDGKLMAAGAPDLSISVLDKEAALIAIEKGSQQKGLQAMETRFRKEE